MSDIVLNMFSSEYDALAKVIQQHPDRQETLRLVVVELYICSGGMCMEVINDTL